MQHLVFSVKYSKSEFFARESHTHVELIDFDKFVGLWQEYYPKLSDEEKALMPLHPIYFIGAND